MSSTTAATTVGVAEFPLWGGQATVAVCERGGLPAALAHVKRTVAAFDLACSSFREDSELALLNSSPGESVVVSRLLLSAVREALTAARQTDGAVDPTIGQALIAHGINPPMSDRPIRIESVSGYRVVKLDDASQTIRLPAGVRLDLGATAKALAADRAAGAAHRAAGCGVLVSLGGDISAVGPPPEGGWSIRVTDDHRNADGAGQTVSIQAGGLATSSVTVRQLTRDGQVAHHLLDPATGRPVVGPWRTASVHAESCLDANTASTAAIVLGHDAPAWLEERGLAARLVSHDGSALYSSGWPSEGDDLPDARG